MTTRAVSMLAAVVTERSGGRCEAVWTLGYRCRNRAEIIHHRLPRSRARRGREHLLDLAGDAGNLAHLCGPCEDTAERRDRTRAAAAWLSGWLGETTVPGVRAGIVVPGSVTTGPDGHPIYVGGHPAYRDRYPDPRRAAP